MRERGIHSSGPSGGFTLVELVAAISIVVIIAAIALPNFLASRKYANEVETISALRTLTTAQLQYRARFGVYGDLASLRAEGMIDEVLGSGRKAGYVYEARGDGSGEWQVLARPLEPGETGDRYFMVDTSGVIRQSEAGPPSPGDQPIP